MTSQSTSLSPPVEIKSRSYRARILTALGFGFFIDSAEDVALPLLFPAIRSTLGLDYSALSVISNIRIIFQTFSGPFWGMAADRFSRKWILVLGTGLWGIWTLLCGLVTDYWQLLLVRVVACIGLGCLYPAAFSILADAFGPKQRGRAMGTISSVGMFGIVVGALAFGEMLNIPDQGWRLAFISLGAASILSGLVIALLVREPVRGAAEPELEAVITEQDAARFRFQIADIKAVLRVKTVWINFLQGIFVITTINALSIFFVTWLVDDRGISEADAPLVFGGIVVSLAIGNLVGGIAGDWADRRWTRYGRALISQFSIAVSLPAMWYLFTGAKDMTTLIIFSAIAGFFLDWTRRGAKQPMVQNVVRPELRSTAMALTEFVQGAVASVVILVVGGFAQQYGLTRTLLILTCGFWTVAFLTAFGYYLTYPRDAARLRQEMQQRRGLITGEG